MTRSIPRFSHPSASRDYLRGAQHARDFLHKTQQALQHRQPHEPRLLRWEHELQSGRAAYQAGFLDGIGAVVLAMLSGSPVADLPNWNVVDELERPDQQG